MSVFEENGAFKGKDLFTIRVSEMTDLDNTYNLDKTTKLKTFNDI